LHRNKKYRKTGVIKISSRMFFEVPDWNLGKPVSEEEAAAKRRKDAAVIRGSKPVKKVKFAAEPPKPQEPAKKINTTVNPMTAMKVSKLTDSKESNKLKSKLMGSRFRYLNQLLYESDSKGALSYFQEHPDDFHRYHEGFQEQTKKWPTNPVDIFIGDLKRDLVQQKKDKEFVVADLGCGEGKLGLEIMNFGAAAAGRVTVHSYDLVSVGDHVEVASMTAVPLESGSVDLVIFSLSLMNTNFGEALLEANRLLRPKGSLWIAEVESRFECSLGEFVKRLKALGFDLVGQPDTSHRVFVMMKLTKRQAVRPEGVNLKEMASSLSACKYKKR